MLKKLLSFALVAVMSIGFSASVFASESEDIIQSPNQVSQHKLYISTDVVPNDAIDYAINNVYDYLTARSDVDNIDLNNISMGTPFIITKENETDENIYYFPVFVNDTMIYTFRVYMSESSGYVGILSEYMVKELNSYINRTDSVLPLHIYIDNGNVMSTQGVSVEVLEEDHFNREPINVLSTYNEANGVVDILKPIEFVVTLILP